MADHIRGPKRSRRCTRRQRLTKTPSRTAGCRLVERLRALSLYPHRPLIHHPTTLRPGSLTPTAATAATQYERPLPGVSDWNAAYSLAASACPIPDRAGYAGQLWGVVGGVADDGCGRLRTRRPRMIARIWRGTVRAKECPAYAEYVRRNRYHQLQGTPGNRGAWLLWRVEDGHAEFITVSFWESRAAIEGFAGADIDKAVYYPERAVPSRARPDRPPLRGLRDSNSSRVRTACRHRCGEVASIPARGVPAVAGMRAFPATPPSSQIAGAQVLDESLEAFPSCPAMVASARGRHQLRR